MPEPACSGTGFVSEGCQPSALPHISTKQPHTAAFWRAVQSWRAPMRAAGPRCSHTVLLAPMSASPRDSSARDDRAGSEGSSSAASGAAWQTSTATRAKAKGTHPQPAGLTRGVMQGQVSTRTSASSAGAALKHPLPAPSRPDPTHPAYFQHAAGRPTIPRHPLRGHLPPNPPKSPPNLPAAPHLPRSSLPAGPSRGVGAASGSRFRFRGGRGARGARRRRRRAGKGRAQPRPQRPKAGGRRGLPGPAPGLRLLLARRDPPRGRHQRLSPLRAPPAGWMLEKYHPSRGTKKQNRWEPIRLRCLKCLKSML